MNTFYEGLEVRYKEHLGVVDFICDRYITICVRRFEQRSRNVCILVYASQWKDVKLLKQSDK
jgi:hypothetical protein